MKQLVFWLFFCFALPAMASSNETATTRYEEARTYYYLQQYEKALVGFQSAYLLSSKPVLLLNIAQCYRQLDRYEEAIRGYKAYLDADPKTTYRSKVEALIKEVEEKQKLITTETVSEPSPEPTAVTLPAFTPVIPAERELTMSRGRMLGISAGAFLLGTGSGALALSLMSDDANVFAETPGPNNTGDDAGVGETNDALTTPNYAAIGAVSAVLVTGGVIWWKLSRRPKTQKTIEAVF
jgi:tetratricopeptide (TPR) repeat protein